MMPNLNLWLIPVLPLIGAALNGLFGKRLTRQAVASAALAFSGAAFGLALFVAARFSTLELPHVETVAQWIRAGNFRADFAFYLDQLSLVMLLVVTGVGFLIHIYSVGYMWEEDGFYRFFSYLNLFMFFMLTLVLANNYLAMFIGWEGVGLASYLLIGFFFLRDSAASAGKKAFIVNRVGDFGFLIALFLLIKHFGSLDFTQVFQQVASLSPETAGAGLLTAIGLLLMVGAAGKSAQLPLYVWLPDAMEGPTPVSALIHAFGGEQDMRKMGGLKEKIPWTFWTMTAGTVAIAGIPPLAGFFSKDEILWRAYQASWAYWLIGLFTAFLTSFYMFRLWFMTFTGSYRGATEEQHAHAEPAGHSAHLGREQAASVVTLVPHGHGGIHESPRVMLVPLVILALLSVVGGWIGIPGSMGGGNHFDKFLAPVFHTSTPYLNTQHATPGEVAPPEKQTEGPEPQTSRATELLFTGISVFAALLGFVMAAIFYYLRPELPDEIAHALGGFYHAVLNKYYVDELYSILFVKPVVDGSSRILWHGVDQSVIDATLDDSADGARHLSDTLRHMQSGNIRSYAGWVAAGAAAVIVYMVWMGAR